jgi:hypothetical protein
MRVTVGIKPRSASASATRSRNAAARASKTALPSVEMKLTYLLGRETGPPRRTNYNLLISNETDMGHFLFFMRRTLVRVMAALCVVQHRQLNFIGSSGPSMRRGATSRPWSAAPALSRRRLCWATRVRNKAVSSLTREDVLAYEAFLAAPMPAAILGDEGSAVGSTLG